MSLFTSLLTFQILFTSPLTFQSLFTSQLTIQNHVTSQLISQSLVTPRYPRSVLQYPSLVSSVRDAPVVSARAAGISKPSCPCTNSPVRSASHDGDCVVLHLGCVHHFRNAPGNALVPDLLPCIGIYFIAHFTLFVIY